MIGYLLSGVLFIVTASVAQPAEPAQAAACQHALDELKAVEDATAAARKSRAQANPQDSGLLKELEARRKAAARSCLGGPVDSLPPPPRQTARSPLSTSPGTAAPEFKAPLPPAASPPLPAPPPGAPRAPPVVITACDASGCLASDGTRLQRAGPNLLGPRGLCAVHGTLLSCP